MTKFHQLRFGQHLHGSSHQETAFLALMFLTTLRHIRHGLGTHGASAHLLQNIGQLRLTSQLPWSAVDLPQQLVNMRSQLHDSVLGFTRLVLPQYTRSASASLALHLQHSGL
jgi:hypothetical protein